MRWLVIVLLAGCGGGGSSAEDAAPPADAAAAAELAADLAADVFRAAPDMQTSPDMTADRTPPDSAAPADARPDGGAAVSVRVMPLGDSITEGGGSPTDGRYRVPLFRRVVRAGKLIEYVGSQTKGPATVEGKPFPKQHEGHTGYAIDGGGGRPSLAALTPQAIRTHQPQVVLLMIGTNDVNLQVDLANAPMRLAGLIDRIFEVDPKVMVILAQIIPGTDDAMNARVRAYNAAMPALVKARADAGRRIVLVDMYSAFVANPAFKTALMADQLHPNDAGDALIGDVWFSALQTVLP